MSTSRIKFTDPQKYFLFKQAMAENQPGINTGIVPPHRKLECLHIAALNYLKTNPVVSAADQYFDAVKNLDPKDPATTAKLKALEEVALNYAKHCDCMGNYLEPQVAMATSNVKPS